MELVKGRLYLYLQSALNPGDIKNSDVIINLDDVYKHNRVRKHFGPPSLKVIWKHCDEIDLKMKRSKQVFITTSDLCDNINIEKRTVTTFLMGCYAILRLNWSPELANDQLLDAIPAKLAFFRDYHGDSSYKLNILDCLRGLHRGCKVNKWFTSYASTKFPQATNIHLDMDWIIPGKFIAFKDPTINRARKDRTVSKMVTKELKRCGIKVVVRLNGNDHQANLNYYGNSYNHLEFKQEGFFHYEIPFEDVSIPSVAQVYDFIRLCERYGGKIAVHCHAGLGRTATMLGSHLMKNHGFDSRSACGWLKLCRRGSVMGPQHFFLDSFQRELEVENPIKGLRKMSLADQSSFPGKLRVATGLFRAPQPSNVIRVSGPTRAAQQSMKKYEKETPKRKETNALKPSLSRKPIASSRNASSRSITTPTRSMTSTGTSRNATPPAPSRKVKSSAFTETKKRPSSRPKTAFSTAKTKDVGMAKSYETFRLRGASGIWTRSRSNLKTGISGIVDLLYSQA